MRVVTLLFSDLGIRIRPERGMMVAFPSNRFYKHGVEPVTRGHCRYDGVLTLFMVRVIRRPIRRIGQQYGVVINN